MHGLLFTLFTVVEVCYREPVSVDISESVIRDKLGSAGDADLFEDIANMEFNSTLGDE